MTTFNLSSKASENCPRGKLTIVTQQLRFLLDTDILLLQSLA